MTTACRTGPLLAALAVLAASCGGALGTPPCEDGSCGTQVSTRRTFQVSVNRKLDVLFVIDDTAPIAAHAEAVTAGLADIATSLAAARPPISLHAGFVRAGGCDASTRGAACGIASPEQFLRSEWCDTITNTNASGAIAGTFACLADLGASNCGPAQPLATAVQWLASPPRAGWEGFLRPEAALLVVVVSATDDASGSPTPVSAYVSALKALKPDPYWIMVSVIGPGDCGPGDAPGPRLVEFAESFGANGLILGLCSGAFSATVDRATFYEDELRPPCLANVRDTDAVTPGLQPRCTVTRNSVRSDGSIAMSPVSSCDASQPPCWQLVAGNCAGGGQPGWLADIVQTPDWCIEAAQNVTIECLGCLDPTDPACQVQP